MTGGVKLRKPSKEFEFENVKEAAENDRAVAHYEKLMQDWINEIENYVEEGNETKWESNDLGPRTELDYWRSRNQRLTSINEQKKSKEVNFVRQVLN